MIESKELLTRSVEDVIIRKEVETLLSSGKKLKVYLGIDPTSTKIHLGNAVPLRKLRDFQNAGHEVIFLVGSFTALIGDTSDKEAMRKPLTIQEIETNFKTYKEQAAKILDFSRSKIMYNGEWLSKLTFTDVVKLAQNFTVQQMIERDMYQLRLQKGRPIGLHEFLYPLMQGYDSVAMNVDLEVGGTDQTFNMLAGRTLQKIYNNREKYVLTTPLIEGTDGRKMSKTYNNVINIDESPKEQFGKIMSMADEMIIKYFICCTDVSTNEILQLEKDMKQGKNPRDFKIRLAKEIVALYHSKDEADKVEKEFIEIFSNKGKPDDISVFESKQKGWKLIDLLLEAKLVTSKSEARRLIDQNGIKMDDLKVTDPEMNISLSSQGVLFQVGKRRFTKAILI